MISDRSVPFGERHRRNPYAEIREAAAMEDIQERYRDLRTRIGNLWEYL